MVLITYASALSDTDPELSPVIVVGKIKHLKNVEFADIGRKFGGKVTEDLWQRAVGMLNPSPTDSVNLYLNHATVAALPSKCSRHNTPSRAHSISKILKGYSFSGADDQIVIVCEKRDVFASASAVARCFWLYTRKTGKGMSANPYARKVNVEFILSDGEKLSDADLQTLEWASNGIQTAAKIVDTPCNEMHVNSFLDEIRSVGVELGITPLIIQGEDLKAKGMGGIYGVGKAAVNQPALAVLSHTPAGATETIAWVGKGIVYDTGGLSIKGKTAMPGMKRDCGGAAGILGAFYAAVKNGFTQNLHALFCLAENSVSDRSTRPDDIHTLYSGKTVEIDNTDAEGRLVVSDGVVYAQKDLKADVIVDVCTLTGAQGISTGRYHAAHLTNSESWELFCSEAGRTSGDLSFPLVYCPELHFPEFSSAVADMKNSVADRSNAQSSCAGLFINAHLGFDFPGVWLHVDMASPAHSGERATGYGVALLNVLFGKYSASPLLQNACPIVGEQEPNGDDSTKSKKMRTE